MEEVTARVYLVSISRSRYSAVYVGGHAKTALLHAAISAAAHQMCEMLMNVQFRLCRDERSELLDIYTIDSIRVFENCFFWHGLAWVAFTLTRARQFCCASTKLITYNF